MRSLLNFLGGLHIMGLDLLKAGLLGFVVALTGIYATEAHSAAKPQPKK